jgi:hypothetical protein
LNGGNLRDGQMGDSTAIKYVHFIRHFITNELGAVEFEHIYLQMFKSQQGNLPEPAYQVLDALFSDVDSFCSDPSLCSDDDLNEDQLRERCVKCLNQLAGCS